MSINYDDWKTNLPEYPENECAFCGEPCAGEFCSRECAKANEND